MANVLQIKRNAYGSGGAPASLSNAELAYDGQNDILYIGKQTSDAPFTVTPTVLVQTASTSVKGVAKFNDLDFNVTAQGEVTLETTSTAAELNLLDGALAGTVVNSKAAIYGASGQLNMDTLQIGNVTVTSTAEQLNRVDTTAGTVEASKAVVVDANKDSTGIRNLTITGDLTVEGTTTTIESTEVTINDKNIVLAYNETGSPSTATGLNGAGITIGSPLSGTAPSLTWNNSGTVDYFEFSKPVKLTIEANTDTGSVLDFGVYSN